MSSASATQQPVAAPTTTARIRQRPATVLSAILAATFLVYLRTAWFGFVYDDAWEIVDNIQVHSWSYLRHYFTAQFLTTPYYRPLFALWFRINDAVFGLNPAGWHVTNVLVHVGVTALVYLTVRKLASSHAALVAAAIFGLHPVHIESVAWASGVCDLLSAVFLLTAFLAYLKSVSVALSAAAKGKWTLAACLLFLLALLTKEPGIVFPGLVALHAWLFPMEGEHRFVAALRRSVPFFAVAAVYLVLRQSIVPLPVANAQHLTGKVMFTVPSVVWFYLAKLFWPVDLNAFYDLGYVTTPSLSRFIVPAFLLIASAALVWYWARRSAYSRGILFGAAWFVLTLAPALYIRLLPEGEIVHDRYLYVPSIGFAMLIAIALTGWWERLPTSGATSPSQIPRAMTLGVLVALAGLNVAQQGYWKSDATLYAHGYAAVPSNITVANNYARMLTDGGLYQQAIPIYERVLERSPEFSNAHYNLGYSYYRLGDLDKARLHFERAVQLDPKDGFAYVHLGLIAFRHNDLAAAESAIRHGIQLAPDRPGCHLALSFVLERKGDLQGAVTEMRDELKNSPGNPALHERESLLQRQLASKQ